MMLRTKGHSGIAGGNEKWYPHRKGNFTIANKIVNALTSGIAISLLENFLKIPWKKFKRYIQISVNWTTILYNNKWLRVAINRNFNKLFHIQTMKYTYLLK